MDAHAHAARRCRDHPRLLRFERPGRGGRRERDAAHAVGRRIVVALRAGLDRFDHAVERLGRRRHEIGRIERARLGGATAAEHQADAELFGDLEDHVRGIEAIALRKQIVVIGRQRGARQQQLDEPDPRRRAQRFLIDLVPVRIRHRAQPFEQRRIDARAHAFEHALEEMMVGRDETRIDHATGRIDQPFAGFRFERADRRDASVDHPDRAAGANCRARKPGEDPRRAVDEHRRHVSAATSLSCHWPSASFESPTMMENSPTPASVMRKSAANMRGMSSWNPDCRIS